MIERPASIVALSEKFPEVNDLANSYEAACLNLDKAAQQSVQRTRAYCECKKPIEFLYGDIYYCKVCNRPCR